MVARVDTGAALTAIPDALRRQLKLKTVRKVRIRVGNDNVQPRRVVRLAFSLPGMDTPVSVEASVRTGTTLGKTPILGRNLLAKISALIYVTKESHPYVSKLDSLCGDIIDASHHSHSRRLRRNPSPPRPPPLRKAIIITAEEPFTFSTPANSNPRIPSASTSHSFSFSQESHHHAAASQHLRKNSAIDDETIVVRVDTGATLTAIPVKLAKALELKPVGSVKVRLGTDDVDTRDVVKIGIQIRGVFRIVHASVRDGPKLGRTAIIGRNFLSKAPFLIRVEE